MEGQQPERKSETSEASSDKGVIMAGLPDPKVVANLKGRGAQIDAAEAQALGKGAVKPVPKQEEDDEKPITADEAAKKSAQFAKDREVPPAPKPTGVWARLKAAIGAKE
jgi:hypothetical protein